MDLSNPIELHQLLDQCRAASDASGIRSNSRYPEGSYVIDITDAYTPESVLLPSPHEVEPWVDAIIRLWDNADHYSDCAQRGLAHAQLWHPERVGPIYSEFFRNVQSVAPLFDGTRIKHR